MLGFGLDLYDYERVKDRAAETAAQGRSIARRAGSGPWTAP
jgi:hypothetical protein